MRKLTFQLNLAEIHKIKKEIVPTLFTEHQFNLIEKKFSHKSLTPSERNEFSRTISRKMNAIYALTAKESSGIFIFGKEKIIPSRLQLAITYLKKFSRKFKNKTLFITGSFLHQEQFQDIDIFVISKYDKEDYQEGKFHLNYLSEEAYGSLFLASARKLCVSNTDFSLSKITEKITSETYLSLYQELMNDIQNKSPGIKKTLREFLLQDAFLTKSPLPNSLELHQQVRIFLRMRNPQAILRKLFVRALVMGMPNKKEIIALKEMIASYKELIEEYPQHQQYYGETINTFKEVIALGSAAV